MPMTDFDELLGKYVSAHAHRKLRELGVRPALNQDEQIDSYEQFKIVLARSRRTESERMTGPVPTPKPAPPIDPTGRTGQDETATKPAPGTGLPPSEPWTVPPTDERSGDVNPNGSHTRTSPDSAPTRGRSGRRGDEFPERSSQQPSTADKSSEFHADAARRPVWRYAWKVLLLAISVAIAGYKLGWPARFADLVASVMGAP